MCYYIYKYGKQASGQYGLSVSGQTSFLGGGMIERIKQTFRIQKETFIRLENYWLNAKLKGDKIYKGNIVDEAINFYLDYKEGDLSKLKEININEEVSEITNKKTNNVEISIKNFSL